jgi:protease-4
VRPPGRGSGWRILWSILLVLSVMANIVMFLMLVGLLAVFATGQRGTLAEEVIREGPGRNRIAMVTVQGIIHGQLANDVHRQLKAARQDRRVKGIIVRVNSPGGTISASDQIYKDICDYREEAKKPVVAFMQGVAASGGYYASVACDKIVAEPTTMTGSIGVISWWLVVQELLEDKLGVQPVTIKSGQRKDWPSSFRQPAPEELQYMQDKLITPAYERFVEVVAEGRKETLSPEEVRQLSDGSIYGAQEAFDAKLIDEIGYLDRAVDMVKSMAGIDQAEVVEYRKPFSLTDFLSYRQQNLLKLDRTTLYEFVEYRKPFSLTDFLSYRQQNLLKLDRTTLYELGTPQILYLWSAY